MPPIYNMGKFNMSKYESKYKEGKHKKKLTSRYPDFSQKKYKTLPSASINNNYTTKLTRYPDYPQKTPQTLPSASINNNYIERIQSLTGREIFDHLNSIPFDEKLEFTASLTNEQLDKWHKVIKEGLRSESNKKIHTLTNNGYGIRNKKHSTRHKKRRGKKTRKYKY